MATPPDERGTLLAVSVELSRVRGCLLEEIGGQYRLAAWLALPRLPDRTMPEQIAGLCRQMGKKLGRRLWDDSANTPLLASDDHTRHPPLAQVTVALSPLPCLRVWLAGLTPGRSLAASQSATRGGPAQIVGSTYLTSAMDPAVLARQMVAAEPDVIVLTGGFDLAGRSVQETLCIFAGQIAQVLGNMPLRDRPEVLVAGNQDAAPEVERILRSAGELRVTVIPNVMPGQGEIRQDVLAPALEEQYWRKCQTLPGFSTLEQWMAGPAPMTTLESNFARLVHAWMEIRGLPELHGVYCTADHRIHVWARAGQPGLRVMYTAAEELPAELQQWPQPEWVSGAWPARLETPPVPTWWDYGAMAPLLAPVGSLAPHALFHVLNHDILSEHETMVAVP